LDPVKIKSFQKKRKLLARFVTKISNTASPTSNKIILACQQTLKINSTDTFSDRLPLYQMRITK
jgi:hypothetical protein